MKAHVLYGVNDLRFEDADKPAPKKDEVLLKVESVGICGSDIPRIYETGAHRHPLIPGHEFAGTICEEGENAALLFCKTGAFVNVPEQKPETVDVDENGRDSKCASLVGKRVGVFPLIPCGECAPCKNKQYEMCRNYNYLGSRCDGAFAEYVAVPVKNLIELPDNVSFEDAAMLEPTAVAAHAMRRLLAQELMELSRECERNIVNNDSVSQSVKGWEVQDGEGCCEGRKTIAVIGLGTIGLLLTMHLINEFGKDPLYDILVVGNKEFQRKKALELGISPENFFDSKSGDVVEWLLEKTGGMGADAIFECVGKNETYSQCIEAARPAGKVMLLGNPASNMELDKNIYWKILRNQLTVMGTWNSSFTGDIEDDWNYVINKLREGAIKPSKLISHRLRLEELESGLHIMRDKTEDYVKIMVCDQI